MVHFIEVLSNRIIYCTQNNYSILMYNYLGKHHTIEFSAWMNENLPGVWGNKGTKKKYLREHGIMKLF